MELLSGFGVVFSFALPKAENAREVRQGSFNLDQTTEIPKSQYILNHSECLRKMG